MGRVQQIRREAALNESIKPANNRVPLVLTYYPHTLPICNLITKNFDILQADDDTPKIFHEPPVTRKVNGTAFIRFISVNVAKMIFLSHSL